MNDLVSASQEYSFNVDSRLFHQLPEELRPLWKEDVENAFVFGGRYLERRIDTLFNGQDLRSVVEDGLGSIESLLYKLHKAKSNDDVVDGVKKILKVASSLCMVAAPSENFTNNGNVDGD